MQTGDSFQRRKSNVLAVAAQRDVQEILKQQRECDGAQSTSTTMCAALPQMLLRRYDEESLVVDRVQWNCPRVVWSMQQQPPPPTQALMDERPKGICGGTVDVELLYLPYMNSDDDDDEDDDDYDDDDDDDSGLRRAVAATCSDDDAHEEPLRKRRRREELSNPCSPEFHCVGGAATTGFEDLLDSSLPLKEGGGGPPPMDCLPPAHVEFKEEERGTMAAALNAQRSGVATTHRVLEAVVRIRVLSAHYHPLVDPDTQIFQQDLARRCATHSAVGGVAAASSRCVAAPYIDDGDHSTVSLLRLFAWGMSANISLGDSCVAIPEREEVISMWERHDDHEHCSSGEGGCSHPFFKIPFTSLRASSDSDAAKKIIDEARHAIFQQRQQHANHFSLDLQARNDMVIKATTFYASRRLHDDLFLEHFLDKRRGEVALRALLDERVVLFLDAFEGNALSSPLAATYFRSYLCRNDLDGVISFPLFSASGCDLLGSEVRHVESFSQEDLPRIRPNSMNHHGLIVNDVGLKPLMTYLCNRVLFPLASLLLPAELTCGNTLDDHHSFVVEYGGKGGDVSLDMHSDDSEVTFNVNLRNTFQGSSLRFCGMPGTETHRVHRRTYSHELGRAVVHAGALRHGALPIEAGERMNLIVWCRSSWHRQQHGRPQRFFHPQENTPDVVCLSRSHDHDYETWMRAPPSEQQAL